MKKFYSVFFLLFSFLSFAQIPSNYYDSANGLSGYALKTELKNITSTGHINQGYDALYNAYETTHTDNYYENDGSVLDFYSENPVGTDPYFYTHGVAQCGNYDSENDCYNREHIVPQSTFDEAEPMKSDVHHVVPTDGYVNNRRSSYPFGVVASASWTSLNGSKVGTSNISGYSGTVFEPIDEFKGDIARALLYFATRYESTVDGYTSFDMFNGTEDQVFQTWAINMLLDWHYNIDPVDQSEIDRNNAAYNYQGNANPFVDHPEYANMIWNPSADTQAPDAITDLNATNPSSSTIYLMWTEPFDNIGVTSYDIYVDGSNTYNTSNTNFTITGLSSETNYCFTVYAKDAAGNTSSVSNQDCETTLASGSASTELFISEYVEGSLNNKVIEIANFTGASISLSSYTLARNTNSGTSWGSALQLTGTIPDQDVFVIARGDASAAAQAQADQLSSADAMSFNGDDPVGLFKNGSLIDLFGNYNGSNPYSNKTYRRKSTVAGPTTNFNVTNEWDEYPQDTFDGLGSHSQTLSANTFSINNVQFFPNPLKGNRLIINTNQSLNIEIFNVLGKSVIIDKVSSNKNYLDLNDLSKGIYLVKLSKGNQSVTKKLIRQ